MLILKYLTIAVFPLFTHCIPNNPCPYRCRTPDAFGNWQSFEVLILLPILIYSWWNYISGPCGIRSNGYNCCASNPRIDVRNCCIFLMIYLFPSTLCCIVGGMDRPWTSWKKLISKFRACRDRCKSGDMYMDTEDYDDSPCTTDNKTENNATTFKNPINLGNDNKPPVPYQKPAPLYAR